MTSRPVPAERELALYAVLVSTLMAGIATVGEPGFGMAVAAFLALSLLAYKSILALPSTIFLLLTAKPVIDLAWRWRFMTIAEQGVNVQSVVATFVIMVAGFGLVLRRQCLVVSKTAILFLVFATVSVGLTPTSWGINELIRLYAAVSVYFLAGTVLQSEKRFERFARYYIVAVMVPVLLSFLQKAGLLQFEYWDWLEGGPVGRASGTYQHPLGLIYFVVYATPLALYLFERSSRSWFSRLRLGLFIGLCAVAVGLTYHRAGILAIGLEMWLWMIVTKRYGRAAIVAMVSGLVALLLSHWVVPLYANVIEVLHGSVTFTSGEFLRGRGMNWYLFLSSLFSSHPLYWILGRGGSVAEGFVPGFGYWSSNEPHNDFIRILHAYGLVGLGLYLALIASFVRQGFRLRRARDSFSRGLGNLVIVVVVAMVLLSITTEPMRFPTGAWYLFMLGSVATVRCRWLVCAGAGARPLRNR
ncbi:MAG: hypothetical protein QXP27_03195 [Candidatus Methanomethyliaceae archaeon]